LNIIGLYFNCFPAQLREKFIEAVQGCSKAAKLSKDVREVSQQGLTPPENTVMISDSEFYGIVAQENKIVRLVLVFQVLVTLVSAGIAYSMKAAPQFAIAVLCGGGISVANGALLAWRMARSALQSAHDMHYQLRLMYFYAAERFLVVVVLLAMCMLVLKLSPLAIMGGFVMGQAALIATRLFLSKFKDN